MKLLEEHLIEAIKVVEKIESEMEGNVKKGEMEREIEESRMGKKVEEEEVARDMNNVEFHKDKESVKKTMRSAKAMDSINRVDHVWMNGSQGSPEELFQKIQYLNSKLSKLLRPANEEEDAADERSTMGKKPPPPMTSIGVQSGHPTVDSATSARALDIAMVHEAGD